MAWTENAGPTSEGVDPKYRALEQRLNQVTGQFESFRRELNKRRTRNLNRVSASQNKRVRRQPAHPFFDEVAGDILALMKATRAGSRHRLHQGDPHERAVYEKVQLQRTQAPGSNDAAKKAASTRRDGCSTNGMGTANGATKPKSLEQDLRDGSPNWHRLMHGRAPTRIGMPRRDCQKHRQQRHFAIDKVRPQIT